MKKTDLEWPECGPLRSENSQPRPMLPILGKRIPFHPRFHRDQTILILFRPRLRICKLSCLPWFFSIDCKFCYPQSTISQYQSTFLPSKPTLFHLEWWIQQTSPPVWSSPLSSLWDCRQWAERLSLFQCKHYIGHTIWIWLSVILNGQLICTELRDSIRNGLDGEMIFCAWIKLTYYEKDLQMFRCWPIKIECLQFQLSKIPHILPY